MDRWTVRYMVRTASESRPACLLVRAVDAIAGRRETRYDTRTSTLAADQRHQGGIDRVAG
jgi:hypothetical protein